jgi:primosomal protein N' (replication factor Y)
MEILEIIPFYKTFKKDTLSYFSMKEVPVGSIVTITIRNRDVKGLVISSKKIEEEKADIKNQTFSLKKIKKVEKNTILDNEVIQSASDLAEFYATSPGAIITSVIPKFVLNNLNKIKKVESSVHTKKQKKTSEKYIIQESETERYSSYKRLTREEFAKKKSVLFICPTKEDVRFAYEKISKGIDENTFTFHSGISQAELLKKWNTVIKNEKPVLIITTPTYMSVPRSDLGSIVVEREGSRAYRGIRAPYIDYRVFAEKYAKNKNIRFFLGDLVLRLETLIRLEDQEFHEFVPAKYRNLSTAKTKLIDMSDKEYTEGDGFVILSDELKKMTKKSTEENENTFLFTSRKGLSPTIVCMDCGHIVECNNCNAPMVLHGKDPKEKYNSFLCHRCGEKRSAGELCKKCESWRLKSLGIGTQLIKKELEKDLPNAKIFILDGDHAKTAKQAHSIIENFNQNPGSILIGTEMALLYLREEIDNVGIVSIDSMFSHPDFNINEKIINTISHTKSKAIKNFIVQTRKADESIFKHIISGNIAEFIRFELDDRKKYNYPPYSILIKIIIKGTIAGVEKEIATLRDFLSEYEFSEYPIIRESTKTKITKGVLLRFDRKKWPKKDLVEKLKLLPAYYKIVVNTENIF